jgi:transcriptional regulator with XRE-family HTH domain
MKTANANRLRELREQRGLQLYDVATIVRRSQAQVSRYETGQSETPARVIRLLAKHYGVSAEFLMGWDDDGQPEAA